MNALIPRFVLGLLLLVAMAACDSAANKIVGKWQAEGNSAAVWEFSKNGVVTTGSGPGKYTVTGENRLKIQTQFATFVYEMEIKGDTMKWRDRSGSNTELKRVR